MALRVGNSEARSFTTHCNDEGNFKLTVSTSAYQLRSEIPGYVVSDQASLNRLHRAGDHVIITLAKGGVITGRVTDELGLPMIGTQVYLRMVRTLDGQPPGVKTISRVSDRSRLTDDRGVYRLYGLEPGVYIVNVNDAAGDEGRDAPTYYPSATRDTAAEITVHGGEEVPNIDIRHRAEQTA